MRFGGLYGDMQGVAVASSAGWVLGRRGRGLALVLACQRRGRVGVEWMVMLILLLMSFGSVLDDW